MVVLVCSDVDDVRGGCREVREDGREGVAGRRAESGRGEQLPPLPGRRQEEPQVSAVRLRGQ